MDSIMKDEALGDHVSMKGVLSVMTLEAPTARTVPDHSEAGPNDNERIGDVLLAGRPIRRHEVLMADI